MGGEWLLNARFKDGPGFYSFYFWQSIVRPRCNNYWKRLNSSDPVEVDFCNAAQMWKDLRDFRLGDRLQCVVLQESLMQDLRECLVAYELSSELAAGRVDWATFDLIESNSTFREQLFQGSGVYGGSARKLPSSQLG